MANRRFEHPTFKADVAAAIQSLEQQTSAEVVVAMRPQAQSYRDIDYLVGTVTATVGLLFYLRAPWEFPDEVAIVAVAVGFGLGVTLSLWLPVRRWFTRNQRKEQAVLQVARALFVELGIHRTRRRNGLLVLISLLEQRVEVVGDIGINSVPLGLEWPRALDALSHAVRSADADAFVAQLTAMGPILGAAHPRAHDDENELSNAVVS
jgi:putative membrane protein